MILLDVMLPGVSGFDICRELRKEKNLPIIMVTAKKTDVDKIRGLGLEADDYIIKPFSPTELVARVQAHIRIHERLLNDMTPQTPRESRIDMGNLKIYALSHRVMVKGKEVTMTNKEFELLLFLTQNPNIVFSRDTLFDRIWGMDAIGDMATVTVKRLKRIFHCQAVLLRRTRRTGKGQYFYVKIEDSNLTADL